MSTEDAIRQQVLTCYDHGRRYLQVRSGEKRFAWRADFRWQGMQAPAIVRWQGGQAPAIVLRWAHTGWRYPYPSPGEILAPIFGATCPAMRVTIQQDGYVSTAFDSFKAGRTKSHLRSDRLPGDPEHVRSLLSLARSVAAGKAPPDAIFGYIEDHLPEPYCALATDDPIRLFRALCPIPLLGWSDCYAKTSQSSEAGVPPEHDPRGPADGDAARADDGLRAP